ncbi:hypothetical protein ACJMK2_005781, partial [Sinanodonta woodiana]
MDLLRHHYIQVFETARKWIMEKIAMPLIGAANLVNTSEDDKYECSCLFVNTLKEVIESRGEDMTVKEIHLVDLDEKIISLLCRAFQDTMDSNINQTVRAAGRKPSSTPKSEKSDDQRNVENLSGTCSFDNCKRKVERKCKNCLKVVCKLCIMDDETQCPFCKKNFNLEEKKAVEKQGETVIPSDEVDNCPICMETLTSPKILPCGHKFHAECIDQSLKYKKTCPICGQVVGQLTGYQPPGKMNNQIREDITPPGFEKCGTIEISYDFPDGVQGEDHPHPGMSYRGTRRRAYLPNNTEGQKVLKLLQVAFDRKLIFTIGESRTTGKKNIVTWNDIHHKTRIDGGPTNFGYPDETYLKRVQEELADKGVTEKDIRG